MVDISWLTLENKLDIEKLIGLLLEIVPFDPGSVSGIKTQLEKIERKDQLEEFLKKVIEDIYKSREKQIGDGVMRQVEKYAYLGSIDKLWIDHIDHIDDLREGITLRAYGQRDPLVEFKNEAFSLFEGLMDKINEELARRIFRVGVMAPRTEIPLEKARTNIDKLDQQGLSGGANMAAEGGEKAFSKNSLEKKKIGRNDPCWCGSGKKWKKCHYPQEG
jgi:preprotein translocase subunit SecA